MLDEARSIVNKNRHIDTSSKIVQIAKMTIIIPATRNRGALKHYGTWTKKPIICNSLGNYRKNHKVSKVKQCQQKPLMGHGLWKKGQKETSGGKDQEWETPSRRSNRLGGTKVEGSYFGCLTGNDGPNM